MSFPSTALSSKITVECVRARVSGALGKSVPVGHPVNMRLPLDGQLGSHLGDIGGSGRLVPPDGLASIIERACRCGAVWKAREVEQPPNAHWAFAVVCHVGFDNNVEDFLRHAM